MNVSFLSIDFMHMDFGHICNRCKYLSMPIMTGNMNLNMHHCTENTLTAGTGLRLLMITFELKHIHRYKTSNQELPLFLHMHVRRCMNL